MKVESQRDLRGIDVRSWHQADILNALANVGLWGQSGQGLPTAYQRHAANEIKQAGIGKRLSGGPSGSLPKSMRSATHNVSASAPTLTITMSLKVVPSCGYLPQPSKGVGATNNCNIEITVFDLANHHAR